MRRSPKISAIIVACNEEALISRIISELDKQEYSGEFEIILADGGSADDTIARARNEQIKVVISDKKGKSYQMNMASKVATGEILFFVHADMTFPKTIFSSIQKKMESGYAGGGFSNVFDKHNQKIKGLGNYLNLRMFDKREQSDKGIFYGDNGIFVRKDVFDELNGFKPIPIMEDYDFSMRLKERHSSIRIKEPLITVSARRHVKAGFFKTRMQWILIKKMYLLGVSPHRLAKWYADIR